MGANGGRVGACEGYIITSGGCFRVDGGYIRAFLEKTMTFTAEWAGEG